VNVTPLLAWPATLTTTGPVVAPAGTSATMAVTLQLSNATAATPLNVTVLDPWVDPKFEPPMVTESAKCPVEGVSEVIDGVDC
jgi:hypothetical protein